MLDNFSPIAAIATTPRSAERLSQFCQNAKIEDARDRKVEITLWVSPALAHLPHTRAYEGSLKDCIAQLWLHHRAFIFGLATGAVVRTIAPLLRDKSTDPAVVVVDEGGNFVISLCSGHRGGADRLARLVALHVGATPVVTGAADGLGLPAVDMLGVPFGWQRGAGDWLGVSAALARGETVQVFQEAGSTLWQQHLPSGHPFIFGFEAEETSGVDPQARIWVGFTQRRFAPGSELPKVQWHPRVLWVGVGCERGTSRELIDRAIERTFAAHHLARGAIAGIATIDLKADEVGLLELCGYEHWPLETFTPERLASIEVPSPSEVVAQEVGTPSVAEAAAICAASDRSPSGQSNLLVTKQIYKEENQLGAVTVAVALAEVEHTGRVGRLWLVGTGPGQLEQMTPAAQSAIVDADAIVGYKLYIDLIRPLLRPGQIVEALPITQERERAERAIELANWGLTVAVVSSGDCGIYGMAGLVFEELRDRDWDGTTPAVRVFPGLTALQAAASRVGAPLMHDFCAISLSDLLTPWETIEKRLKAAAEGDFVVALYNPKSKTRTQQIAIAQKIFLACRPPQTPVAIVRSAYRTEERVQLTTLEKLLENSIDMLSTVLIGNTRTGFYADWMITPRGYLD
ncbi:MAG: precorrin-3B C(17)-methyltransferase [Cyanobacteriota bacterium]|nr:precorrin-3B C(17)-methyltransferase [Cyanobacteriota bacterium]